MGGETAWNPRVPYTEATPSVYSSNLRNLQVPFNLGYLSAFGLGAVDIIQQTRTKAEYIKTTLRHHASTPGSAQYLNIIIPDNNNVYLNSVEDLGSHRFC